MKEIAVDVMSGDNEPGELIQGCISSVQRISDLRIHVVGNPHVIAEVFDFFHVSPEVRALLPIVESEGIVEMDENPAVACRKKPKASVMVGCKLVKDKVVDGFFSPGNTGATLAASLYVLGRISGVKRPAIGVFIPSTAGGHTLILDGGANMDCSPKYLYQFAVMGREYYRIFFGVENPSVGLLNIGSEEGKGDELAIETYDLLAQDLPLFKGNIEPPELLKGKCHVIVCDGFAGNVLLKSVEGTAKAFMDFLKEAYSEKLLYKIGLLFLKGKLKEMRSKFDPKKIGAAPLIGVDGNVFIGHGSSNAESVESSVRTMLRCMEKKPIETIRKSIENS